MASAFSALSGIFFLSLLQGAFTQTLLHDQGGAAIAATGAYGGIYKGTPPEFTDFAEIYYFDDFDVPAGTYWNVTQIQRFGGHNSGQTWDAINGYSVNIYSNDPSKPFPQPKFDSYALNWTGLPTNGLQSDSPIFDFGGGAPLMPPGKYWLSVTPKYDYPYVANQGGYWSFRNSTAGGTFGEGFIAIDLQGFAFGAGNASDWKPRSFFTNIDAVYQDFAFGILGYSGTYTMTTAALTTKSLTTKMITTKQLTTNQLTTGSLTTQPLTTKELTTQPLTTAPLTSGDITTKPLTTSPLTTKPLTTKELTTKPLTTKELTTQPLTTKELTTQPLTTKELTTQPLTTKALTSGDITTQPLTTKPLTTKELTTQPLTTKELTTQPLTTKELTTQPLTTKELTTQPLTTKALTSGDITTQPLTTKPLTTSPLTTQELTTQELTTQPLTTQELTTMPLTTQPLTTQELTTQPLTTQPLTTQELTTGEVLVSTGDTTGPSTVDITIRFDVDINVFDLSVFIDATCDYMDVAECDVDDFIIKRIWEGSTYIRFELIGDMASYADQLFSLLDDDASDYESLIGYSVISVRVDPAGAISSASTTDDGVLDNDDSSSGLSQTDKILIGVLVGLCGVCIGLIVLVLVRRRYLAGKVADAEKGAAIEMTKTSWSAVQKGSPAWDSSSDSEESGSESDDSDSESDESTSSSRSRSESSATASSRTSSSSGSTSSSGTSSSSK
eukprot:TRINITY_DN122_c0_g1_i3.p1 TRINITY_DN122_c0_g1~~TRINITY_DN122_c0_g1_i3.p1  ORF type:complete len:727 (-),score=152.13 TRINITY_DN122_c0_g1_i3:72-2252(-)